jgi:hypothetical protein
MLYQILALFGNWIDFNFRSSLDIVVYVSLRMFNLYKIVISWFSIILVLRSRHWPFPVLLILMMQPIFFLKQVHSCALVDACLIWTDLIILISRPVRWDKLYQSTHFKGKLHKLPIILKNICNIKIKDFLLCQYVRPRSI